MQNHAKMEQPPTNPNPNQSRVSLAPSLHQSDADDDDENVKQLRECSSLYLSLQDCLVKNNRNWKSCQIVPNLYVKPEDVEGYAPGPRGN